MRAIWAIMVALAFCGTPSFAVDMFAQAIKKRAAECANGQKRAEAEAARAGRPAPPPKPCPIGFVGVDRYPRPNTAKSNQ